MEDTAAAAAAVGSDEDEDEDDDDDDASCKVCRVYAETCQSSGGSGRKSWQKISQRRRAAAKKAGQNAYATCIQSCWDYYDMMDDEIMSET